MKDSWSDRGVLEPEELHRRLSEAVAPISPTPDSLNRLRTRVTARRRQRQALTVGGAAAAVTGIALTAVLVGPAATGPSGQSDSASPGSAASGDDAASKQAAGTRSWPGPGTATRNVPPPTGARSPSAGTTTALPVPTPSGSAAAKLPGPSTVPGCTPDQLKKTDNQALVNKQDGSVGYGYLEFVNASAAACTVTGPPRVEVVDVSTGADTGFATAARSAADSPALADIPSWGRALVLQPQDAYRFQFAWTNKAAADSGVTCASRGLQGNRLHDRRVPARRVRRGLRDVAGIFTTSVGEESEGADHGQPGPPLQS